MGNLERTVTYNGRLFTQHDILRNEEGILDESDIFEHLGNTLNLHQHLMIPNLVKSYRKTANPRSNVQFHYSEWCLLEKIADEVMTYCKLQEQVNN